MSANDPLPQFPDQPPDEAVPPPPAEIMREPDLYGVTPEPTQPVVPAIPPLIRPRPPHPGFWAALLWCIGFLLVTQIPGAVVAAVILVGFMLTSPQGLSMGDLQKSSAYSIANGAAFTVAEVLVIGVSWLVLRLVVGRDWKRRVALRRPGLAHVGLVLASFPAMVLLANGAYFVLRSQLHLPNLSELLRKWVELPAMEEMARVFGSWPWAFAVLIIGLGPGIGEELWCRAFLGRGLVGRYGTVLGVLFTSFYFGLIHIDPAQGAIAMLLGLWLHFVYLTTRSLWMPMLLHFLNNSLAVIAPRTTALSAIDEPEGIPWVVFAAAGVLLAAVAWALYQSRARLVALDGTEPPPWRPAYPGVEYPPPGSETRVAHPRPSWAAVVAAVAGFAVFVAMCYPVVGG
jgi:membrane protease YdiL (CAAX protease family)